MNILFTSVGRRAYLLRYFKEATKGAGKIYAVNSTELSTGMAQADEAFVSPVIYSREYVPFLAELCEKKAIDLLIPLFDVDLPVLAAAKASFKGTFLAVSEPDFVNACNDKLKMNEFLSSAGLDIIETFTAYENNRAYFEKEFEAGSKFIIKPRWGMGSLGIYQADNLNELRCFYNKANKDIASSYLKYEAENDRERAVIIQKKIRGTEYGIDIINDFKGNFVTAVIKEKLAMRAGETDISKVVEQAQLYETAKTIALKSRHIGNLDMDIILNENGAYVIDMNARFGGGYPFSHAAGINLPKAMLLWCINQEAPAEYFKAASGRVYAKDIELMRLE